MQPGANRPACLDDLIESTTDGLPIGLLNANNGPLVLTLPLLYVLATASFGLFILFSNPFSYPPLPISSLSLRALPTFSGRPNLLHKVIWNYCNDFRNKNDKGERDRHRSYKWPNIRHGLVQTGISNLAGCNQINSHRRCVRTDR